MSRHPFGEIVGIKALDQDAEDTHGNPVESWADPVDWPGCAVAPSKSDEPVEAGRTAVITLLDVFGPYDMVVGPHDRAVWRGTEYEVVGEPGYWSNPFTGATPGCEFKMRRADG